MSKSRNTFEARYDSRCRYCEEPIEAGDQIGYVDDEINCEGCWEDASDDRDC